MKLSTQTLFVVLAACASFATSAHAQIDAKKECADAYDKTQTFREQGKLIEARKQASSCIAPVCSVYVTRDCAQWLAEIDTSLPTVVFTAEDAAGLDTTAVRVSVDGKTVAERLDGKATPIDPGEHIVRFEMSGEAPIERRVLVRQGEKNRRIAASFAKAPIVPAPRAHAEGVPVWAWIVGAGGLALVGVAGGFGVAGLRAQSEVVDKCEGDASRCPVSTEAVTLPLANRRTMDRNVFIGLGAAGLVAIGAAVIGIARAPRKTTQRTGASFTVLPFAGPSSGGLIVRGGFE